MQWVNSGEIRFKLRRGLVHLDGMENEQVRVRQFSARDRNRVPLSTHLHTVLVQRALLHGQSIPRDVGKHSTY